MQNDTYVSLTPDLLARCKNQDLIYSLACFDAWILNGDRHANNFIVRRDGKKQDWHGEIRILPIDHTHALLLPKMSVAQLEEQIEAPLFTPYRQPVILEFVKFHLTDWAKMDQGIAKIESISDDAIDTIVNQVPAQLIQRHERESYIRVLKRRRRILRDLFKADQQCLPFLDRKAA